MHKGVLILAPKLKAAFVTAFCQTEEKQFLLWLSSLWLSPPERADLCNSDFEVCEQLCIGLLLSV